MWEQDRARNWSPAGRWDGGEGKMVAAISGMLGQERTSLGKGSLAPEGRAKDTNPLVRTGETQCGRSWATQTVVALGQAQGMTRLTGNAVPEPSWKLDKSRDATLAGR